MNLSVEENVVLLVLEREGRKKGKRGCFPWGGYVLVLRGIVQID